MYGAGTPGLMLVYGCWYYTGLMMVYSCMASGLWYTTGFHGLLIWLMEDMMSHGLWLLDHWVSWVYLHGKVAVVCLAAGTPGLIMVHHGSGCWNTCTHMRRTVMTLAAGRTV
jgi:hypothetical protein